jgi:diadenosine tetraphosphate (Ap4A) HIT family hydrolase
VRITTDSGWPDDWEERKAGKDCPMCSSMGGGDNEFALAVTDLPMSEVKLERGSRVAGYCVVIWKHGHVAEPSELDEERAGAYWLDVIKVGRALEKVFAPLKINYLTLGNTVPHLHTHVVPRYVDDPAPGGPITWKDMFADVPPAEETLRAQAEQIRAVLEA